jgi:hypothetical protein
MDNLEEKKKQAPLAPRYPLGTIKQAKGTLARLARDVLNKKIDIQDARAAAYVVSQLIQLFKIETPEQKELDIKIGKPDWIVEMPPEERNNKMQELLKKAMPFYDDYMAYANKKTNGINSEKIKPVEENGIGELLDFENQMAWADSANKSLMDIAVKKEQGTEPTPAEWKPRGIGVKRG